MPDKKVKKVIAAEPEAEVAAKEETKAPKAKTGVYFEAVGRRKTAIARVRLFDDGKKKITVNGQDYKAYFGAGEMLKVINDALVAVGMADASVSAKVNGGGKPGQADAVRHGIARAILKMDKDRRSTLKPLGYLTRDSRQKERKKPGKKRARRSPQWSKR